MKSIRGSQTNERAGLLIAAASVFFLATGIGRFTYTAILPSMLAAGELTHRSAAVLASINLTGYLLGALLSMLPLARIRRGSFVCLACVAIVAASAAMAIESQAIWILARFSAGVAGGVMFVLGSSIVLDYAALHKEKALVAIAFGGVGIGIATSGLCAPLFTGFGGWRAAWIGFSALGVIASFFVFASLKTGVSRLVAPVQSGRSEERVLFMLLLVAYGAEGVGYIIPATFLVAMATREAALAPFAESIWILVGIVAIPSVLLWNKMAQRFGDFPAMTCALMLQAAGFFALYESSSTVAYVLGAAALGATFIGISALGVKIGRDIYSVRSNVTIAGMTVVFGIGQIVGPLFATAVTTTESGYGHAILLACAVIVVGTVAAGTATLVNASRPASLSLHSESETRARFGKRA